MINHKTTRTKQSHCQPSRLNKPTYSNQLNEINETTKPNQPDQAKPSNKKQTHYCKPYRFCAKKTIQYLGHPKSKENHPKNTEGLSPINKHLGFIWILPYFCLLENWAFLASQIPEIPHVPCCIIQLEDQWSTLCSLSVGTKSKSGSANSGLAKRFEKCGVTGG